MRSFHRQRFRGEDLREKPAMTKWVFQKIDQEMLFCGNFLFLLLTFHWMHMHKWVPFNKFFGRLASDTGGYPCGVHALRVFWSFFPFQFLKEDFFLFKFFLKISNLQGLSLACSFLSAPYISLSVSDTHFFIFDPYLSPKLFLEYHASISKAHPSLLSPSKPTSSPNIDLVNDITNVRLPTITKSTYTNSLVIHTSPASSLLPSRSLSVTLLLVLWYYTCLPHCHKSHLSKIQSCLSLLRLRESLTHR